MLEEEDGGGRGGSVLADLDERWLSSVQVVGGLRTSYDGKVSLLRLCEQHGGFPIPVRKVGGAR
jgi:hypothetical protein